MAVYMQQTGVWWSRLYRQQICVFFFSFSCSMFFTDTTEDPADLINAHYRATGECSCMVHNSSCITTQQQQETVNIPATTDYSVRDTLIKKKIQLSSYVHMYVNSEWSSCKVIYMTNSLLIYGEIFTHSLVY
jgi:hypothetical protein